MYDLHGESEVEVWIRFVKYVSRTRSSIPAEWGSLGALCRMRPLSRRLRALTQGPIWLEAASREVSLQSWKAVIASIALVLQAC